MDYLERDEKIEYIRKFVPLDSQYQQLAEECSELAQASLKYIRAMGNGNPTPVLPGKALTDIFEEAIDVYLCMIILDIVFPSKKLDEKLDRWYNRVKEVNNE